MSIKVWQTTRLDEAVAEELFGWRWMSYVGIPTRSAPDYPQERRVRRFFPPLSLECREWIDYFAKHDGAPATGDEPLGYSYCSSCGPAFVPHFSGDMNECRKMEKELRKRGHFVDYLAALRIQHDPDDGMPDDEFMQFADCKTRCVAALAAIGSKYVQRVGD